MIQRVHCNLAYSNIFAEHVQPIYLFDLTTINGIISKPNVIYSSVE